MTDRLKGFTVVLDKDIREDDVASIQNAIMHIRNVQAVVAIIATPDDWMARERVKGELREKLYEVLK